MCALDENGVGEMTVVSICSEAYRANACQGDDGNLYLTYDAYVDGAYHTLARACTAQGWTEEIQLDNTDEWTCQSHVIASDHGATVCWYTFGYGATFSVCSADICVKEGTLVAQAPITIAHNVGWYMDLTAASKDGLQILCYTWGKDAVQLRYRRNGGNWSEPAMMSYEDIHCAVHPSIYIGENEEILMAWQFAFRNNTRQNIIIFQSPDVIYQICSCFDSCFCHISFIGINRNRNIKSFLYCFNGRYNSLNFFFIT